MILNKISIKRMIFFNTLLIFLITGGSTLFIILSTSFIQKKLSHLTAQSTPFQVKTIQTQAMLEKATAILTKMASSSSVSQLNKEMAQMKEALNALKQISSELTTLFIGDNKIEEVIEEFSSVAEDVYSVTKEKIEAEKTSKEASSRMSSKLAEIAKKLQDIDTKINGIQHGASEKLSSATGSVVKTVENIRDLYALSMLLQSIESAFDEIKRCDNQKALDIAKGKFSLSVNRAVSADFFKAKDRDKEIKKLYDALKDVHTKVIEKDGFSDAVGSYFITHDAETKKKADSIERQIAGKIYSISSEITSYIDGQFEDAGISSSELKTSVNISELSNSVLLLNSELISIGRSIEVDASRLLLTQGPQELMAEVSRLSGKFTGVELTLKKLSNIFSLLNGKDDIAFLSQVSDFFNDIKKILIGREGLSSKIEKVFKSHQRATELSIQMEKMVLQQQQKNKTSLDIASDQQRKATIAVNRLVRLSTVASIILGCVGLGIGIVTGIAGAKTIGSSISQITSVADSMAKGDLTHNMEVEGPQEIRSMKKSFITMKKDLTNMIQKIIESSSVVSHISVELYKEAEILNQGVQQQLSHTEQAASSIEEMSQTIGDVARNASEAARGSRETSEVANKGQNTIENTITEMAHIIDIFQRTGGIIEKLGVRSSEIGNIINVINEITEQTNMLALNAAIEAARAGEYGRGFAVVADEVRKLAERTAQATGQVSVMIKAIQDEINDSVLAMRQGRSQIEKTANTTEESRKALKEIVSVSNKSTEVVNLIAVSTEEQSQVANGIASNMENMLHIARESEASANLIKKTSQELTGLAENLRRLVTWFNLGSSKV